MKTLVTALTGLAALLYAAALSWLWFYQEKLIFQPEALPAAVALATAPDVREITVPVDGAQLSVLQLKLPKPRGVVFFLHGNSGNLSSWFIDPDFYRRANMDMVMMDYRGYGKSTGSIRSEAQLRADVRAVWAQFAPLYPQGQGQKVVLLGRSLGTALASGLALELEQAGRAPNATLLISPYESMATLAALRYPFVPQAVLRYPLRNDAPLAQLRSPVTLIHGTQDTLITPSHSQTLQRLAPQAKLQLIDGAAHNDLQDFDAYLKAVRAVLDGA
jgi:uncharacterized protein